jgi:hypothetical protein
MTTVSALPIPPSRSMDAATFVVAADAFLAALPTLTSQINVVANEVMSNADLASSSATDAEASAEVTAWVSGRYYTGDEAAISQIDFQVYRRKTAGSGTYDPKRDAANWTLLNPIPAALTIFMHSAFGGF